MEFGSDFHSLDYPKGKSLLDYIPNANLYTSGRQSLLDLAMTRGWKRIWVPSYFCEETLDCIPCAGIGLSRYDITPSDDPLDIIPYIPVGQNEGLLIVNYFGLFDKRYFPGIECEIVEDHTHNLTGNWALNSCADWCIASLRKTLPIADGGILWSPKNHILPEGPRPNDFTESVMSRRVNAMNLKRCYLAGKNIDKGDFLKMFGETEGEFEHLPVSTISDSSLKVVKELDIKSWYDAKHRNWEYLYGNLKRLSGVKILTPECPEDCPFSLTLLMADNETRNKVRRSLMERLVYPAILWTIENNADKIAKSFGDRMLSIHCDGRYTLQDMEILLSVIKDSLN